MPLTQPNAGGLKRALLVGSTFLRNNGNDSAINFTNAIYDPVGKEYILGGNTSYVGSMANLRNGKLTEYAALPSTVITSGNVNALAINSNNNGVMCQMVNDFAQTIDGGISWSDISTGLAISYNGIQSWRDQLIALHTRLSAPTRDYGVSLDNGASWPFSTGLTNIGTAGVTSREFLYKYGDDKKMFAFLGGGFVAWTERDDLTAGGIWENIIDIGTGLGIGSQTPADFDMSPDGVKGVLGLSSGEIVTTIDGGFTWSLFPVTENYFRNTSGGNAISNVIYVLDLDGFIIYSGSGPLFAFIPADGGLDTMEFTNYAGDGTVGGVASRASASDGTDYLIPGNSNRMYNSFAKN